MTDNQSDGLEDWKEEEYTHDLVPTQNDVWDTVSKNHVNQRGYKEVLAAGIYFVGDISSVLTDAEISQVEINLSMGEEGMMCLYSRRQVVVWSTLGSCGTHVDDQEHEYLLARPLLGIVEYSLEGPTETEWGQVIGYKNDFSCTCYDGYVDDAEGGQHRHHIRYLNFGENVNFTLYESRSNENMRLLTDKRLKKEVRWRNRKHKTEKGDWTNHVLYMCRVLDELGLNPQNPFQ
jgi:hypothetical protein